ncbi:MAG: amino acid adenylation domain-containing protein, partial [Cytophagales bacterium]|nr:amino acid adenylation domain-containing protein [Cytophagales bacterium]
MQSHSTDFIPASPQQVGIWFHALGSTPAFWNFTHLRPYTGVLDVPALKEALRTVLERHSSLRTNFRMQEDKLSQVIRETTTVDDIFEHLSYGRRDEKEAEAIVRSEVSRLEKYEFDLENDLLLRFRVFQFGEKIFLVLVINHIITDLFSTQLFWNELAHCYNRVSGGGRADLPPAAQYHTYALAQEAFSKTEEYHQQKQYWAGKLSGELPAVDLQFYADPGKAEVYEKGVDLPAGLVKDIKSFALKNRVLYSSVFQLAYFVLLHKYCGQHKLLVGNVLHNRGVGKKLNRDVIGLFANRQINTLVIEAEDDLAALLQKLNGELAANLQNVISYEEVVRETNARNKQGLFQPKALFNMIKKAGAGEGFEGLTACAGVPWQKQLQAGQQCDILLLVEDGGETAGLRLELRCEEPFRPLVDYMLDSYLEVLKACVYDARQKITGLAVLTAAERARVLADFNDTRAAYPGEKTIADLWEEQAARVPDAVAVVCGDEQCTYRQLDERANKLAHYLQKQGLAAQQLVGVCLKRSPQLVVALLAVLKAGAAYLPLDPAYPPQRIGFMLQDSAAPLLITSSNLAYSLLSSSHDDSLLESCLPWATQLLVPDELAESLEAEPLTAPLAAVSSSNLAYVMYTPGATGRPNGVKMPHRALVNLLYWQQEQFANQHSRRVLQFAGISSEASFQEIFSTLCFGGSLHLDGEADRKDAAVMLALVARQQITHLFVPYAVLQSLAEEAVATALYPASLQEVITAEEQFTLTEEIAAFAEKAGCTLTNQYGPAEAPVVCAYPLRTPVHEDGHLPLMGKPVSNTRLYILDRYGNVCSIGAAGELYIGGVQVTSGYLNRDDLTEQKFIADAWGGPAGARLYRTGDLARWLPDGNLEYLGRIDEQVKVRGYRIELGEIESVLAQHPLVRQAAVVAQPLNGEKQLVAYLVMEAALEGEQVRAFL